MPLPNREGAIKTLGFDRSHESFRVRVEVRASWRELDRVQSISSKHVDHGLREERVAIVNQIPVIAQEPIGAVELLTQHIAHPITVRPIADPRELHRQAVKLGLRSVSEAGRLDFVALAQ